jgi:hypothetical protein
LGLGLAFGFQGDFFLEVAFLRFGLTTRAGTGRQQGSSREKNEGEGQVLAIHVSSKVVVSSG